MTIHEDNRYDRETGEASEIRRTLDALFEPGAVVEMRAFSGRWTKSGYFDDHGALVKKATELEEQGWQIYVTLNEVDTALLARANNRVLDRPEFTTSDGDIVHRRWLLLDLDPVRPAKISATNEEKRAAYERAKEVRNSLRRLV